MFAAVDVSYDNVDCIPGERIEDDELNLEDEQKQPRGSRYVRYVIHIISSW